MSSVKIEIERKNVAAPISIMLFSPLFGGDEKAFIVSQRPSYFFHLADGNTSTTITAVQKISLLLAVNSPKSCPYDANQRQFRDKKIKKIIPPPRRLCSSAWSYAPGSCRRSEDHDDEHAISPIPTILCRAEVGLFGRLLTLLPCLPPPAMYLPSKLCS